MIDSRYLTVGALVATLVLAGCATSRSELRLTSPSASQTALAANAPVAVIRSVKDERRFELAPSDPSTPSLGFEGALEATAEAKLRAIGRKRNTFGKALGDVFLQDGQTVETVIRENLASALRDAGYNVRDASAAGPSSLVVDVRIKQFWAWIRPGFWAITVSGSIATDLQFSTVSGVTPVAVQVQDGRQLVTDSAWIETIDKALQEFRREASKKIPVAK